MSNEINPNWIRWLHASIMSHLETELLLQPACINSDGSLRLQLFQEGEFDTSRGNNQERIEFRVDGPYAQPCPGDYGLYVEINCLISVLQNESNLYRPQEITGAVAAVLSKSICLKKLGVQAGDDSSTWAVLRLGRVFTVNYGKIGPDISMVQSTVEVHGMAEVSGV